ncbi:hypothetical protein [Bacillus sp. AFS088145]|uniref:hypothetical protein n=1 Tax=Bacillus sp. AFS088145 TaxID=2033514 RepID=UPI000BF89C50|nr:hypothetical protein [Bacillus sp. AFS088145]PFH83601.1 hypothetical protein COI44_17495 [Bacillus sp. AFS088145]
MKNKIIISLLSLNLCLVGYILYSNIKTQERIKTLETNIDDLDTTDSDALIELESNYEEVQSEVEDLSNQVEEINSNIGDIQLDLDEVYGELFY